MQVIRKNAVVLVGWLCIQNFLKMFLQQLRYKDGWMPQLTPSTLVVMISSKGLDLLTLNYRDDCKNRALVAAVISCVGKGLVKPLPACIYSLIGT